MSRLHLIVASSLERLTNWIGEHVLRLSTEAIAAKGSFSVAFGSGSTPRALYQLVSSPLWRGQLDWSSVEAFLGDERYVPVGDPRSNYRMLSESLLNNVLIPSRSVHPIPTSGGDPGTDARAYAEVLEARLPINQAGIPVFDLAVVGLGTAGQAGGLFPGSRALKERDRAVVAVTPPHAPARWITLTPPVFEAAENVILLASGPLKAGAVARVVARVGSAQEIPARAIQPTAGTFILACDLDACADIDRVDARPDLVTERV